MQDFNFRILLTGLRTLLWLGAFFVFCFVLSRILFAQEILTFDFDSPNSLKNGLTHPKTLNEFVPDDSGKISQNDALLIHGAVSDEFHTARVRVVVRDGSLPSDLFVSTRRSFLSFLSPVSEEYAPFSNGSLVKFDGGYFLFSDGILYPFDSLSTVLSFGYGEDSFLSVSDIDLMSFVYGTKITSQNGYVSGMHLFDGQTYYRVGKNGDLIPYVSEQAYRSHFSNDVSLVVTFDDLKDRVVSPILLGFSNGTLLSYGISAFVTENNILHPINNPITFSSMGYSFDNLLSASGEDVGIYDRTRLFTLSSPHPSGTVFYTNDTDEYFLFSENTLFPLTTSAAQTYLSERDPITVSSDGLNVFSSCDLEKDLFSFVTRSYSCDVPLVPLSDFLGNTYQFTFFSQADVSLSHMKVSFSRDTSWENAREALGDIYERVLLRFGFGDSV
ncbi:MAG: hypothetical protein KC736_01245 [Candidatus Moranbacteria bacterium]|nr:hypothetical protein [Candidatus Moranbacteria bacterium]